MKKIVVIGGGTMGLDIAQVFARNGYDVVVRDIKDEIIQASEARLNKGLDKLVSKGKLDEAKKAEILSHMSFTTELAAAMAVMEMEDVLEARMASASRRPSWPPTRPPSPSPPSRRPPSGPTSSSACTSLTPPPS